MVKLVVIKELEPGVLQPGTPAEIPTPSPGPADPGRPRNAKGHKPHCTCRLCTRIQAAISSGKPPKAVARAMARATVRQRRLQRSKDRRFGTTPSTRREERIAKKAMLTGAVVAQVASGVRPNVAQAAKIAGMDPSQAQKQIRRDDAIEAALERAGISNDLISQKILEGMNATETRLVTHQGVVTDAIEMPDFHARHKFVTVAMQAKGQLKPEQESVPGGLILIQHQSLEMIPGHTATCQCDDCVKTWEMRAHDEMLKQMKREAITIEHVSTPKPNLLENSSEPGEPSASEPSASESSDGEIDSEDQEFDQPLPRIKDLPSATSPTVELPSKATMPKRRGGRRRAADENSGGYPTEWD